MKFMSAFYALLLLILGTLMIGCKDSTESIHESSEKSESSKFQDWCLNDQLCKNTLLSGEIVLSSAQITPETPFYIVVKAPTPPKGQIVGLSMQMGYIPLVFKASTSGVFIAEGMVGICTTDKMTWQIRIEHADGAIVTREFEVLR
ncbi:hypothetical protein ACFOEE_01775 [Pseudoalteromonas fenneropenaei]|uniref:Lipoprotein n=1 Tax=Pseudoalteromonas fenneropenaei TaxID=1737459 RepID=A0ABV7CF77_9GAMM